MRIIAIAARTIRWTIASQGAARGRAARAAVVLEVRGDLGEIGLGEAAPLPGMSPDTLEDAERAIASFARRVPFELADREAAVALAHGAASGSPAARFAIETALLDALARDLGVSLATLLRDPPALLERVPCVIHGKLRDEPSATRSRSEIVDADADGARSISGESAGGGLLTGSARLRTAVVPLAAVVDDPEAARAGFAAGIRCFKIKLAAGDDPRRVFAIAAAVPGARLRIDANRSWPRAEVAARLAALAPLPIDYVEEPCMEAHQLLSGSLPCRLALDESLAELTTGELHAALHSPQLAAVVLKPTLLGGLSAALDLADLARRAGVAAIASHGLEGPVGTAACAELALALGGSHPAGLAAHAALAGWHIEVPQLAADHVHPAGAHGLGFGPLDLAGLVRARRATSP